MRLRRPARRSAAARRHQDFARQQNNDVLMQLLRCYEQLTLCLQGATGAEGSFDDERFCAASALALMDKASYGAARALSPDAPDRRLHLRALRRSAAGGWKRPAPTSTSSWPRSMNRPTIFTMR
ncbi:hypothetical protein LP420_03700 [Massilia sp. B-10]|nr:hypothetical protein LP420_03700 [Massilia sp. B-10]